jgi:hypothetical protein
MVGHPFPECEGAIKFDVDILREEGFFFSEASDDFGFESGQFALIKYENVLEVGCSALVKIGETNKPASGPVRMLLANSFDYRRMNKFRRHHVAEVLLLMTNLALHHR